MATAWTDLIDPATLTGYARASLADYEATRGTLARWLPNRLVPDIDVRFVAGQNGGLVETAHFRAYDAEPEIGKTSGGQRVTIELPALAQTRVFGEYQQLRLRGADDSQFLPSVQRAVDELVRAIADAMERLRGVVLQTGKATINETHFKSEDDFARAAGHTVTAGSAWSTGSVSRLTDIQTWMDVYTDTNGEAPGSMLMSTRVFRAIAAGTEFQTQLLNGGVRPSTRADAEAILGAAGFPPIYLYDRRVNVAGSMTKVLSDDRLFLLPAPVDPADEAGTQLGGTFWGQTLTSQDPSFSLAAADQPGLVVGVYDGSKPPFLKEIIADAIGLPVLTNANLSFVADVL